MAKKQENIPEAVSSDEFAFESGTDETWDILQRNHRRAEQDGWKNYHTWVINHWLEESEPAYHFWRCQVKVHRALVAKSPHVQSGRFSVEQALRFHLAAQFREEVVDRAPLKDDDVFSHLLLAALHEVEWLELADHWLSECP